MKRTLSVTRTFIDEKLCTFPGGGCCDQVVAGALLTLRSGVVVGISSLNCHHDTAAAHHMAESFVAYK